MAESYDLVAAGEDDLVVADYRSPADGMDAYFGALALAADAVSVVDIVIAAVTGFVYRVCEHKSCAARGVELLVVVALDYLDVELVAQDRSRLLSKLAEKVYPEGHISGEENRYLKRRGADLFGLLGGVAGRGEDERDAVCEGVV